MKRFTNLKYFEPWLRDLSNANVRAVLAKLDTTYQNFYKNPTQNGLPKFKGKHQGESFSLVGGAFKTGHNAIYAQKIGWMNISGNNPYPNGNAVSGTIKRECGKWYVYISYVVDIEEKVLSDNPSVVGIDRNVGQIATSDGVIIHLPDLEKLERNKKKYQRMMSRRKCGSRKHKVVPSNRYNKAKRLHQKASAKIAHVRNNWCHQTSRELADSHDVVVLENLNTAGMTASASGEGKAAKAGLNQGILNSGWYNLEQKLEYKATEVVKVPAAYTSQTCHECGAVSPENRKTQAHFQCVSCGHSTNADINAALNIRTSGIGVIGRGKAGKRVMPNPVERQDIAMGLAA